VVIITGESGAGKTTLALSLIGLLSASPGIVHGKITIDGRDFLRDLPSVEAAERITPGEFEEDLDELRGHAIFMLFQEPRAALNPYVTIGKQLVECLRGSGAERRGEALRLLGEVGLTRQVFEQFPAELSTGMCQRVMIAMALALDAKLLLGDEPLAKLDMRTQRKVLDLFGSLRAQGRIAMLFVTHDLRVAEELADRVVIMYKGKIVEVGPAAAIFGDDSNNHPYTRELRQSFDNLALSERLRRSTEGPTNAPDNACPLLGRCPVGDHDTCARGVPELVEVSEGHRIRCWRRADADG